jgi:hypothetical protein
MSRGEVRVRQVIDAVQCSGRVRVQEEQVGNNSKRKLEYSNKAASERVE